MSVRLNRPKHRRCNQLLHSHIVKSDSIRGAVLETITVKKGAALSVALFVCAFWVAQANAQTVCHEDPRPRLINQSLSEGTRFLCNNGYSVLYSSVRHEALWSAETLTSDMVLKAAQQRRASFFSSDPRLSVDEGPRLSDYHHSDYDRGHLTPSGDEPDLSSQHETYYLSNIIPQTAALNRGIWTGIEMAVRNLALQYRRIQVVTGPGYDELVDTIGSSRVFVPAYTWKAVYVPAKKAGAAYVCSNTEPHPACFTETIEALTKQVGIDPFPEMPVGQRDKSLVLPPPEHSPYTPNGDYSENIRTAREAIKGWFHSWLAELTR